MTSPLSHTCPTRGTSARADTVPTDPLELAQFTIKKYGPDSDKPSVRLAKELLSVHNEYLKLCEEYSEYATRTHAETVDLRCALGEALDVADGMANMDTRRIAELRKLAGPREEW